MFRNYLGVSLKRKTKWHKFLSFALILALIFALPVSALDDDENGPTNGEVETSSGPDPADDSSGPGLSDDDTGPPEPEEKPDNGMGASTTPVDLTTDAEIVFYKTTTGGGNFTSETFSFRVVRVADKFGNPFTEADDTEIDNSGVVSIKAGPNQTAILGTFRVKNLVSDGDQKSYFFKISEIAGSDEDWNYDGREFVIRVQVFEIAGTLVVPKQGQEWFYQGVSYDKKGGGNPVPSNEYNTFINEYTESDTPLGQLTVKKNDFVKTPINPHEFFEFQLARNGAPFNLDAPGVTIRTIGGSGTYAGTDLQNGKFTLTYDSEVRIAGLRVGEYTLTEYAVGYETSHVVSGGSTVNGPVANLTVKEGADASVSFANTEVEADTRLTVKKLMLGDYASWGADNSTVFTAKIVDSRGRYLTFSGLAPNYTFTGTSSTGSEIRFSARQPAVISGIPMGTTGTVEEIIPSGAHFTTDHRDNGFEFKGSTDLNAEVVVTNEYDGHGVGNITLTKHLAGNFSDWGTDENTVFTARIKDVTDAANPYYLDFQRLSDGNYNAVAIGTGSPFIQFSAAKPVVLSMLWDDRLYEVEEVEGANFTASYTGNNARLPEGGNMNVAVTNTFDPGDSTLVISKRLAGSPADWGVDENTVFSARIKDVSNDNYVLFALQPDGKFLAFGNNNSKTPTNDARELIHFTAGSPVVVSGLWTDIEYSVEEIGGANYIATYAGNNSTLPTGGNMNVTITNTYDHGDGNLVIRKVLENFPANTGVNENTVFYARVKDVTDNNYLLFSRQTDGTYRAFANNGSPTPTNDARELVPFTAANPAALTGIWVNHMYAVEEVSGSYYMIRYQGRESMQPQMLPEDGNLNVTVTNTFDPGGETDNGGDKGNLKIIKANFRDKPAKPLEAFTFLVTIDGKAADLSAEGVKIRKTGGSGTFKVLDLRHGKFTLTYDTEVTIDGLPLGTYSVTEQATEFITRTEINGNTVTFTNEEIPEPTTPSGERPNRPDRPRSNGETPEDSVTVDIPLVPLVSAQLDSTEQREIPRTGDNAGKIDIAALFLLFTVFVGALVLRHFRLRIIREKNW